MSDADALQSREFEMCVNPADAERASVQLTRLARRLYEVRAELSAMLSLSPLASTRLTTELALPELLTQVATLEIRLSTLGTSLRHARRSGNERSEPTS